MSTKRNKQKRPLAGAGKSGDVVKVPAKVVATENGKVVRQYPAHVGFHGTTNENELNPEE